MKLIVNEVHVEVRPGTPRDIPLILTFIRALAAFEKLTVSATEESLRAALFADQPAARTLLVFIDGKPVGYAIYFFTFTSFMGKRGLWLEDLFIDAPFRGKGIGQALMAYLADIAVRNECGRFEWSVLDWNAPAIEFYKRLGAKVLTDWRICRVDEAQLPRMAGMLS